MLADGSLLLIPGDQNAAEQLVQSQPFWLQPVEDGLGYGAARIEALREAKVI